MKPAQLGIIGGTGLGDMLIEQAGGEAVRVDTPYGPPSTLLVVANWEGVDVVFIARHGPGHRLDPSHVPYRANVWALKKLGVTAIIASGAAGSLREDIKPGHLILCDQVIDRTFRRDSTFFDEGIVVHVELADPFCPRLRALLAAAGEDVGTTVHHAGTYVCMEGPQFSTRSESRMHRQWGGDVIGMTCMPEAKLAREAEICYVMVALATDYDCWRPHDATQRQGDLLRQVLANLRRATDHAVALIRGGLRNLSRAEGTCPCPSALELAIWSDKTRIDPVARERLGLLIGHRVPGPGEDG